MIDCSGPAKWNFWTPHGATEDHHIGTGVLLHPQHFVPNVCACVRVCACMRACVRERACVYVRVRVRVHVRVRVRVCVCNHGSNFDHARAQVWTSTTMARTPTSTATLNAGRFAQSRRAKICQVLFEFC